SFTTTASNGSPDGPGSTGKVTRSPPGSAISTVSGRTPVQSPVAAALAAAEAQVPVVHPVRSPDVRSATSGDSSGSTGSGRACPVMSPHCPRRRCRTTTGRAPGQVPSPGSGWRRTGGDVRPPAGGDAGGQGGAPGGGVGHRAGDDRDRQFLGL